MASSTLLRRLGESISGRSSAWFGPHTSAAERAVLDRIRMVDLVLEVRDARIPLSSAFEPLKGVYSSPSFKRVIVLNKADLADRSQTDEWMSYFEEQSCVCLKVNSHNKNSMEKLLNFIQAHTRRMTVDKLNHTTTVMLVGVPNVGKSAIATNLHQIGRIKAVEKGKLKHAVVSSVPGETKDINSFKIASHPNVYVLDTPGILAPKYLDVEKSSKLALTGVIKDSLLNGYEIAQCFLAILNSGDKYKSWMNLMTFVDKSSARHKESLLNRSDVSKRRKQFPTDHTQDFIVRDVRRALYDSISSFKGNLGSEKDMIRLIETQFLALHEAFRIPLESGEDGCSRVALKLLNLYRIGRLGHYTLDSVPHGPID